MKKLFFSIVALLLVCASLSSFGQKTDTRIYNIIQMSKGHNAQYNGVNDPNKIWPGQTLDFFFEDGTPYEITVMPGDTESDIIREIIELEKEHGPVVVYPVDDTLVPPLPQPQPIDSSVTEPFHWWWSFPWGWMFLFLVVLAIVIKLLQIQYTARRQNPVTAGTPQVNGGVRDNEAYSRMSTVAQDRFPGSQIVIKNIRRGWLSGWAQVFYANDKTKRLKLKDVAAYAGETMINGREQTIYFLQGCGNDARQGNYMTGNLDFREDVIINRDGSESPIPVVETPAPEVITEEEPSQPIVATVVQNPGSESFRINMRILDIHEKAVEAGKGNIYEETIDFNEGIIGTHIKYQSDKKPADKSVSEKSADAEKK